MQFSQREKRKTAFSKKNPRQTFSRGKNRISQGVENRGSLISVPLALRDYMHTIFSAELICVYVIHFTKTHNYFHAYSFV